MNMDRREGRAINKTIPIIDFVCCFMFSPNIKVFLITSNIKMLVKRIHNEPPKTPVYSYHWIKYVLSAKVFPKVFHG